MKSVLALLVALAMATCAFAQDESSNATALADQLGDAFGKGNLKKVDFISDDASVFWVHAKFHKQKFGRFLQGQIDAFDKRALVFSQEGSVDSETFSSSWGSFIIEYGSSNGRSPVNFQKGRYTAVAQKKDGKWQLVSLHISLPFPPDLPDPIK